MCRQIMHIQCIIYLEIFNVCCVLYDCIPCTHTRDFYRAYPVHRVVVLGNMPLSPFLNFLLILALKDNIQRTTCF